jgi:transcriptional regulator with XRE-family HTH domain
MSRCLAALFTSLHGKAFKGELWQIQKVLALLRFGVVCLLQQRRGTMSVPANHFGQYLQELRKAKRITLREFCIRAQADPGNISRLERGTMPPPQDEEILRRYAVAVEIKYGSDEWYRLVDLAATDKGVVPRDLLDDKEVVQLLPVFFRTLRGQKPTEEEMRRLAEKLKIS